MSQLPPPQGGLPSDMQAQSRGKAMHMLFPILLVMCSDLALGNGNSSPICSPQRCLSCLSPTGCLCKTPSMMNGTFGNVSRQMPIRTTTNSTPFGCLAQWTGRISEVCRFAEHAANETIASKHLRLRKMARFRSSKSICLHDTVAYWKWNCRSKILL